MKKFILLIAIPLLFVLCSKEEDKDEDKIEPLVATSIELFSGDDQTAEIENTLANPVVVIVKNQNGVANAGTTVNFVVSEGSISEAIVTTDTNGKASVIWTLGATVGTQILTITAFKADGITALLGSPLNTNAVATISVTDIDGNKYNTVKIGNQVWMAENLVVTHYADGTEIPLVTESTAWANLIDNNFDDAYCYYNNNANSEADIYGALYTWSAAMHGTNSSNTNPSGRQGVCPIGWHLPSDSEWTELIDYLGGSQVAGGKLKEKGTTHWWDPNVGATNESGFSALPGGLRDAWNAYDFYNMGGVGFWWSTTEAHFSDSLATSRPLSSNNPFAEPEELRKSFGISVRCVKD